jgi:hypothetical protein
MSFKTFEMSLKFVLRDEILPEFFHGWREIQVISDIVVLCGAREKDSGR